MAAREANTGALEKVSSTDFATGSQLTPEQFEDFMLDVENQSNVLQQARQLTPAAESGEIPRLSVGTELFQSVGEGNSVSLQTVDSTDVSFATTKVSLPFEQTWEASNELIDDPEATIRQLFIRQFGRDLEILASVGDTSTSGFAGIEDGWLTVADNSTSPGTYDHGSASIDKSLFEDMRTAMPDRYKKAQNLVFLASYEQKDAYQEYLTDRSTSGGDAMLMNGDEPTPYGFDIITPLGWPDDRVMLTSMENLLYIVQDPLRVKSTDASERNVLNDIETIYNMLAKIDYQIMEKSGVVTASNIAAP
ncbi:hypothetical protein [Haloarcula sp. 1CSR25-25]|uniref:hypothetical protein n=1 Tax=Haloarcula sp. 1CSR25-25 TaxID=2862545 RepID=UPI002893850E|nr:hypothetical protein [Haloarcula sp. 1CSR25-25]MDT3434694.1 hypothetical protein [Haloarcula sp. 1CSR25-25]